MRAFGWIVGLALAVCAVFAAAYGPAYYAAADMLAGANRQDEVALARTVDYPALQADLEADFKAALRARLTNEGLEGPMRQVAETVLSPLLSAMAQSLASPEGLFEAAAQAELEGAGFAEALGFVAVRGRPAGLDRFLLDLEPARAGEHGTRLAFARRGIGWKAVALDFPPGALEAALPK